MINPFRVKLTTPQVQKLHRGQNFQLSNDDLKIGGRGIHDVGIQMSQAGHKALMRNLRANKGFRFSPAHIEGHGLWDSFKNVVHQGAEFVRNNIPQENVVSGVKSAVNAVGNRFGYQNAGDRAEPIIQHGVKRFYGRALKKGSPEMAEKMARLRAMKNGGKGLVQDAQNTFNDARNYLGVGLADDARDTFNRARDYLGVGMEGTGGNSSRALTRQMGLRPRHLIKGSPEAKAYMASIRAKSSKKRKGTGMFDFLDPNKNGLNKSIERTNAAASQALDPNRNGLSASVQRTNEAAAKALDPNRNGVAAAFKMTGNQIKSVADSAVSQVANEFRRGGSAEEFGKKIASELIHKGIPEATAYLCSSLATAAFPAGGVAVGWAASAAGKELGNVIAKKVGEATGYGIRSRHAKYSSSIHTVGGQFVKGIPLPIYTNPTIERIQTLGLMNHHRNKNGLYNGGSFLALGAKGGSFASP